jgi:hypothetical protein
MGLFSGFFFMRIIDALTRKKFKPSQEEMNKGFGEIKKSISDLKKTLDRLEESRNRPIRGFREKVKCAVCQKEHEKITSSHLKTHDLTIEQYQKQFPNALIIGGSIHKDFLDD